MKVKHEHIALLIVAVFWIIIAVLGRIVPHLPNATPLSSLCLLSGVLLTRPKALTVTFFSLLISDLLLSHLYHYPLIGSWTLFTYSGFAFVVCIGASLATRSPLPFYLITIELISMIYWLWTNFGVWLLSGMYVHSVAGLLLCYVTALPFLRNALGGDLIWMITLFCLMRLALKDKLIELHRFCRVD